MSDLVKGSGEDDPLVRTMGIVVVAERLGILHCMIPIVSINRK
jgi:hypothetical protein